MEVIPIIYTVLIIVVLLTIFTLIVSTIGYKMRQRNSENVRNNNGNTNLFEPIVKVVTPLKSDLKPNEAKPVSRPSEVVPEKSVREKKKDDSQRRPAHKDPSKHKVEPRTDKPRIQNERISVLKNLSAQRTQEVILPKTNTKTTKDQTRTLGDDILDKYMEDKDSDMFTLKVKKNKENHEDDI